MVGADSLKDAEHAYSIDIGCELRGIERYLHMRLGCKVVNLGGLYLTHEFDKRHGVTHIGIVEVEVGGTFEVGNTFAIVY